MLMLLDDDLSPSWPATHSELEQLAELVQNRPQTSTESEQSADTERQVKSARESPTEKADCEASQEGGQHEQGQEAQRSEGLADG